MDEYTEITEAIEEDTPKDKSFGQEIAEALAIGIISGVGTLAGFYAFGWAATKFQELQARRVAKRVASDIEEMVDDTNPTNPEA